MGAWWRCCIHGARHCSQVSQRLGGDEFQLLAGQALLVLFHPLSSQHSILESFVHLLHSSFLHVSLSLKQDSRTSYRETRLEFLFGLFASVQNTTLEAT